MERIRLPRPPTSARSADRKPSRTQPEPPSRRLPETAPDPVAGLLRRNSDPGPAEERTAEPVGPAGGAVPADVADALTGTRGHGSALPAQLRRSMEGAYDTDFGEVRLHSGPAAAGMNRRLHARAFTVGADVYLGAGSPGLGTAAGQRLLAHELGHVVQNRRSAGSSAGLTVGGVQDREEHEADRLADQAMPAIRRLYAAPENESAGPEQQACPATGARPGALRRAYADLSDKDREAVDLQAHEDFETASVRFERDLGRLISRSDRAARAAGRLMSAAVALATRDWEEKQGKKESKEDYLADAFGIADRKDISGTVGADRGMILETMRDGTFREKMSLFYVALAERRSLDEMFSRLAERQRKQQNSPKGKASGGSTTVSGANTATAKESGDEQFGNYAEQRDEKLGFTRLVDFIKAEITLERHVQQRASGLDKVKLTPEEAQTQRLADEEIVADIIEKVTGGARVGDETTDPGKTSQIRDLVQQHLNAGPEMGQKRAEVEKELAGHADQLQKGLGWIEMQYDAAVAEHADIVSALVKLATTQAPADELKAELKKQVVQEVFGDYQNTPKGVPFGPKSVAPIEKALGEKVKTYQGKLDSIVSVVSARTDAADRGTVVDKTVEEVARQQFAVNLKANHTFFRPKKGLEHARKGTERTPRAKDQQVSDETAAEFEDAEDGLSYRELGAAFSDPEAFRAERREFRREHRKKKDPEPWQKAFRKHLLEKHKNAKLPWKPGARFWEMATKSDFVQAAKITGTPIAAGLSGTTDRILRAAKLLGLQDDELPDVLLACMGWMLAVRDHSYYEILKAAEPYLKIKPDAAFDQPLIDPDYANGYGYRKMLDFFPELADQLPDRLLAVEYKNTLADRLAGKQEKDSENEKQGAQEGESRQTKPGSTVMSIRSDVNTANAETGTTVHYHVNNAAKDRRYEWFYLRHGSADSRATQMGVGTQTDWVWKMPGIYKIYCLVHNNDSVTAQPVATLRFDQTVVNPKVSLLKLDKKDTPEQEQNLVAVRATWTDLTGVVTPLDVSVVVGPTANKEVIQARLTAPGILPPPETGEAKTAEMVGETTIVTARQGDSATTRQFNSQFRKGKDLRIVHAEAVQAAARKWEQSHYETPRGPGAVNVQILDLATEQMLKEHYFAAKGKIAVKSKGEGSDKSGVVGSEQDEGELSADARVPAYRVQGGDFEMGISSSVRLVDLKDGNLGMSGDASVWVNFTDKARMVWWLSNRSDGSYSVSFTVSPGFLDEVRKVAVPERDAKKADNKGKPIISQDKAAYQYAISRKAPTDVPTLGDMAKAVSGEVFKVFQFRSFDLDTSTAGALPKGGNSSLAMAPNEDLRTAKDIELKSRFLQNMELDATAVEEYVQSLQRRFGLDPVGTKSDDPGDRKKQVERQLSQEQSKRQKSGEEKWLGDYNTKLRKPGGDTVAKDDLRLIGELGDDELGKILTTIKEQSKGQFQKMVGPKLVGVAKKVQKGWALSDVIGAATTELEEIRKAGNEALTTFRTDLPIKARLGVLRDGLVEACVAQLLGYANKGREHKVAASEQEIGRIRAAIDLTAPSVNH